MAILVTGGAGFIGSHVADYLLKLGEEVVVLDDLSGGLQDNVPREAVFLKGSISNSLDVENAFRLHSIDFVFHLAAYAAEGLSHFVRSFNYKNNLLGSINLINASIRHKVKCFVFTSSIAVYGHNQLPMSEAMQPLPEDPYGISKYAVELDLQAAHEMFGLNYIIFRPHNVYGEHQNIGDKYRNVLGIFMNNIMKKEAMSIFGDGKQTRAFSYIGDVAPVIAGAIRLPETWNQTYNTGSDECCSVHELALLIAQAFNVEPQIVFLPTRLEVKHAYASHDKIKHLERLLKMPEKTSLRKGVEIMARWAKAGGPRLPSPSPNIEVYTNLPPSWSPDCD